MESWVSEQNSFFFPKKKTLITKANLWKFSSFVTHSTNNTRTCLFPHQSKRSTAQTVSPSHLLCFSPENINWVGYKLNFEVVNHHLVAFFLVFSETKIISICCFFCRNPFWKLFFSQNSSTCFFLCYLKQMYKKSNGKTI